MQTHIGTLEILPAASHPELFAEPVWRFLSAYPNLKDVGVVEIDPNLSDTAAFCETYHVGLEQSANCVILEAKRGERTWFAVCVVLGNTRADINGLARRSLDARKVSFAPMDQAVEKSGMEYGGITPIGLPAEWPILIDAAVTTLPAVILGSGLRKSKIVVAGSSLANFPQVQVIQGLGQPK